MPVSPFGKYAAPAAAVTGLAIVLAWLATLVHIGGLQPTPQLDAVAYIAVGLILGTGSGALTVANGAGTQAHIANTRLDAIAAPSGDVAAKVVAEGHTISPSIAADQVHVAGEVVDVHPDGQADG